MAIAQRAGEKPALHVVAGTAVIVAAVATARTRPIPRRTAPLAAKVAAVGQVAQGRAGHEPDRPSYIHLPRCEHSRLFVKALKNEWSSLTFGMYFSAMLGTTGKGLQKSYMTYLSQEVSLSGSVRRIHETTYEALREVSPLLGSRSGLNTADDPMADVAAKLAELVAP